MTMGADVAELPALSVATTWTWYAAGGSGPVTHQMSPLHVVALHGAVANTAPLPQNFRLVSATAPEAVAFTSMLLPVHAPLAGVVMLTVGGGLVETVTETLAVAVRPAPTSSGCRRCRWRPR